VGHGRVPCDAAAFGDFLTNSHFAASAAK
jgi:hypothetical protein